MIDFTFYKDRKVLITGHTGFKGAWLVEFLNYLKADVYGYALQAEKQSLFNLLHLDEKMTSYIGDINDFDYLDKVIQMVKPEIVIHMAAQAIVKKGYEDPRYTYNTNVMGTVNLLEAVRNCDSVKSVVNVTTDKVYEYDHDRFYKEEDRLNGYDPYSNSKSCSELVSDTYRRCFLSETALSSARAGNVIGGGDFSSMRIIPDCLRAYVNNQDIIIRNPESIRPYQHVANALSGYLLIAMKQYQDSSYAGCYNVGPDEDDLLNNYELVRLYADELLKRDSYSLNIITENNDSFKEADTLYLDNTKIKNTLGFTNNWNIKKAMEETVDFSIAYKNNKLNDNYLIDVIKRYCIDE